MFLNIINLVFFLIYLVYDIIKLCIDNDIILYSKWLRRSTDEIRFADDLSKCVEADRWLFDYSLFSKCIQDLHLPQPTIDLLADDHNKICSKYYSRYADGVSLGCNWLKYPYNCFSDQVCYLNPPFRGDYLHMSVEYFIKRQIVGYILVPKWPSASWYHLLLNNATVVVEFPRGYQYFQSPSYMTTRLTKKWDVLLVYLDQRAKTSQRKNKNKFIYNSFSAKFCRFL